jgi:hypothetical protein
MHCCSRDCCNFSAFADTYPMAGSDIMLIDRGDLPSLVALGMESLPRGLVLWHPVEVWGPHEPRRLMVERHAEVFSALELLVTDVTETGLAVGHDGGGVRQGLMLLSALALAQELGCAKLIWPVQGGHDPERVGRLVTLSQLAGEMAELEQVGGSVALSLPVVDLSDEQLVDLADDLGVPQQDFWPCERTAAEPCGACAGCIRWQAAFDQAGLGWPWSRTAVG